MEVLRQASKGLLRQAGRVLNTVMRLAMPKGLNHLPDEILPVARVGKDRAVSSSDLTTPNWPKPSAAWCWPMFDFQSSPITY